MQTKKQSMTEAVTNIVVGYFINVLANYFIFPIFGWELSLRDNLTVGVFYTIVSLARSYGLRRLYNYLHSAESV